MRKGQIQWLSSYLCGLEAEYAEPRGPFDPVVVAAISAKLVEAGRRCGIGNDEPAAKRRKTTWLTVSSDERSLLHAVLDTFGHRMYSERKYIALASLI